VSNYFFIFALVLAIIFGVTKFDKICVKKIQCLRKNFQPKVKKIFQIFSCTPLIVTILFFIPLLIFLIQKNFYQAVALIINCVLTLGATFAIKFSLQRDRPLGNLTKFGKIDSSFPSAHTAGSFAAAFIVINFWPITIIPVFVLASFVAISRMFLQFHFFSDVCGGILLAYVFTNFIFNSDFLAWLGFQ
jgi:membrane-associated phospholipid phosphatase